MLDRVKLVCPRCDEMCYHSLPYIQGQIKAMKIGKVGEVVQQLKEKRGPFYDKWLAAMEKRGEPKRCKWCTGLHERVRNQRYLYCSCYEAGHRGGQFACSFYVQRSGD